MLRVERRRTGAAGMLDGESIAGAVGNGEGLVGNVEGLGEASNNGLVLHAGVPVSGRPDDTSGASSAVLEVLEPSIEVSAGPVCTLGAAGGTTVGTDVISDESPVS